MLVPFLKRGVIGKVKLANIRSEYLQEISNIKENTSQIYDNVCNKYKALDGTNWFMKLWIPRGASICYRKVFEKKTRNWDYFHVIMSIVSRHSCNGILTISLATNGYNDNNIPILMHCSGCFSGYICNNDDLYKAWRLYYNKDTATLSLYWYGYDYDSVQVSILQKRMLTILILLKFHVGFIINSPV